MSSFIKYPLRRIKMERKFEMKWKILNEVDLYLDKMDKGIIKFVNIIYSPQYP